MAKAEMAILAISLILSGEIHEISESANWHYIFVYVQIDGSCGDHLNVEFLSDGSFGCGRYAAFRGKLMMKIILTVDVFPFSNVFFLAVDAIPYLERE